LPFSETCQLAKEHFVNAALNRTIRGTAPAIMATVDNAYIFKKLR
jgi:hypothetical protein